MKKHWYLVNLSKSKDVRVFAESADEAFSKAESKVNKRNCLWMANSAYREDGDQEDFFVAK